MPDLKGQPLSTFVGHSHTNQVLTPFRRVRAILYLMTGYNLAAKRKEEKSPQPTPLEIAKSWTMFFSGAAMPPSLSSVNYKD